MTASHPEKSVDGRDRVAPAAQGEAMPPRAREVRRMFSAIAPRYDRLNHLLSFCVDKRWRARAASRCVCPARRAPRPRIERVLDVCAGTGDLAEAFRRRLGPRALVVCADFSHAMLRRAREKYGEIARGRATAGGARIDVAEADALRLPFGDGSFDVSCVAFGLRNLGDRRRGLSEMARVVRSGGQVVALEFSRPRSWWFRPFYFVYLHGVLPLIGRALTRSTAYRYLADTIEAFPAPEEVCRWMRDAGLADVTFEPFSGGIAVLYRGLVP
jgi:demethylmenaquinone methyltransferase/2-methoxy-6-polyprenyl-1,4-benzoquinol methylase